MKKLLLVTMALAVLVLAACTTQGSPTGPVLNPWVGGTEALELEFVPGMPPLENGAILDNDQSSFSIGVKLDNKGEYDIEPANSDLIDVRVRGILSDQFDVSPQDLQLQLSDTLRGTRKNIDGSVIDGQFATATFNNLRYQPDSQGDIPKSFVVDVCYDYKTKSTTPVCLANDVTDAVTSAQAQSVCTVSGPQDAKNSGGPIQVTNFKQQPQGANRVSITFTLSHVGDGEIYRFHGDNTNPCDDSVSNLDEQDEVFVEISLPASSQSAIECQGSFTDTGSYSFGEIKMYDGAPRIITCTVEELSGQDNLIYEDLLSVDLSYRYAESVRQSIVIKDAGN
jgi:hypothetical protein